MEDSFKVRISRTFGSLSSSSQPLSSSALWSLTDEEIERREWNRDPLDTAEDEPVGPPPPFPSNLDGFFLENGTSEVEAVENSPGGSVRVEDNLGQKLENDLESLDDEDDDDEEEDDEEEEEEEDDIVPADGEEQKTLANGGGSSSGSLMSKDFEGDEDDVLEVKNSIGMDCTLDYEEEEDEFDKLAVGRMKSTDRIYLGDFGDYGVRDVTTSELLPDSFGDATTKDPRANHLAAQLRIKEDEEAAKNLLSSLQVSSSETTALNTAAGDKINQPDSGGGSQNLKTILKRKDSEKDSSTEKRVRFADGCKESDEKGYGNGEEGAVTRYSNVGNGLPSVPDYIRNPKGYTHYTFDDDSSDMDDRLNQQACMSFLNDLRKLKQKDDEPPADLSLPVIFNNPKRKSGDGGSIAKTSDNRSDIEDSTSERFILSKRSLPPPGIVAENAQVEDGVCVMDEDGPQEIKAVENRRTNRQYRSKLANWDVDEPSS